MDDKLPYPIGSCMVFNLMKVAAGQELSQAFYTWTSSVLGEGTLTCCGLLATDFQGPINSHVACMLWLLFSHCPEGSTLII